MASGYDLTSVRDVRELLEKYSLAPKKAFGQNFLINRDVPERIAASAAEGAKEGTTALEIGPGVGSMTVRLAGYFDKVVAVEIDRGLIPLLEDTLSDCANVKVINADFLKLSLSELLEGEAGGKSVRVCANLPYYVTTPVLMKILESFPPVGKPRVESVTVMIQSEVAERLCASAGSPDYGAVTASVALHGRVEKLFTVAPGNFYPAPKVTSSVVRITMHERGVKDVFLDAPEDPDECEKFIARVKKLISLAFLKRRKTLTNALSGEFPKEAVAAALSSLGIREDVRGERLTARDFCALAKALG